MADTFTLTNDTPRTIYAQQVEGRDYAVPPGESIDVHARTALLLREYGLTLPQTDYPAAVEAESDPVEDVETRFTGTTAGTATRQHRRDDPRANVAGTPLEETGDTGSPLNTEAKANGGELESADIPKVPAVRNAKAAVTKGAPAVNDPDTQPTVVSREQVDLAVPEVTEPGALSAQAAAAISTPASTGAMRAVVRGAANAPRTGSVAAVPAAGDSADTPVGTVPVGDTDVEWVEGLDRKTLDVELERRGLSTVGMSTSDKRSSLRAYVAANGRGGHQ